MQHLRHITRRVRPSTPISTRTFRHGRVVERVASPYLLRRQQHFIRSVATVTALGLVASAWQWSMDDSLVREVHAESPPQEVEMEFEKPRKFGQTKEDTRDLLSSQHIQVKKSWENPGVYAWGSNAGKVVAPASDEQFIKTPRRIPFFDNILLRDIKLDKMFGAAIDENGDLLQWGTAFKKDASNPEKTLTGKNLTSLVLSRDRIIALGANGSVYSIPVALEEQTKGPKPLEKNTWIPYWSSTPSMSYRKLEPGGGEKVTSIAGGLEHVLLLTSSGRVFSAASSSTSYPSKGQLGIPGLTWTTRPPGDYDLCHEIEALHGFRITKVAAGDYHSVVADKSGKIFTFGDNSFGQLGIEYSEASGVDAPSLVPLYKLYSGTSQVPRVTSIAAGGANTYFTVDTTSGPGVVQGRITSRVTADTWSCGQGIWGTLGTGRWTHTQAVPTKIPGLSGLFEYDEQTSQTIPIRLSRLSVGQNHVAAVMANVTYLRSSASSSENDINWGSDIVFFGNNEFYQLGTGKRNNMASPTYIQPLDPKARCKEDHRLQITPKMKVHINGRSVSMEQRIECGRGGTAIYSGV